jgi:hypothetical protein
MGLQQPIDAKELFAGGRGALQKIPAWLKFPRSPASTRIGASPVREVVFCSESPYFVPAGCVTGCPVVVVGCGRFTMRLRQFARRLYPRISGEPRSRHIVRWRYIYLFPVGAPLFGSIRS